MLLLTWSRSRFSTPRAGSQASKKKEQAWSNNPTKVSNPLLRTRGMCYADLCQVLRGTHVGRSARPRSRCARWDRAGRRAGVARIDKKRLKWASALDHIWPNMTIYDHILLVYWHVWSYDHILLVYVHGIYGPYESHGATMRKPQITKATLVGRYACLEAFPNADQILK